MWWDRSQDNMADLKNGTESYAIDKHMKNNHPKLESNYEFKVHKTWKTSLERQVGEVLEIHQTPHEVAGG